MNKALVRELNTPAPDRAELLAPNTCIGINRVSPDTGIECEQTGRGWYNYDRVFQSSACDRAQLLPHTCIGLNRVSPVTAIEYKQTERGCYTYERVFQSPSICPLGGCPFSNPTARNLREEPPARRRQSRRPKAAPQVPIKRQ